MLRAGALFLAGMAIVFTASMHERLPFDLGLATTLFAVIALVHAVRWFSGRCRDAIELLLAVAALVAALLVPAIGTVLGLSLAIAGWALASALLEFIGGVTSRRGDSTLLGALGVLLALAVLLSREDTVATLGFFGGYLVIAGVFLGISAFDTRQGLGTSTADAT